MLGKEKAMFFAASNVRYLKYSQKLAENIDKISLVRRERLHSI